jgi:hypothetical protein
LLVKEKHFRGPGRRFECCRRAGATCRDGQSDEHVNEKAHRQPHAPAEKDGAPRGRSGDDGNPEAAGGDNRQAITGGNGKNFRFDMRFSVSRYGDSDARRLRDHHLRGQCRYNRNLAPPHSDHVQNGSTGSAKL